jgi:hypothetical protein
MEYRTEDAEGAVHSASSILSKKTVRGRSCKLMAEGAFVLSLAFCSLHAQDTNAVSFKKVTCSGLASYEFGQIYRGVYADAVFEHRWENRVFADINLNAEVNDRLRIVVGLEYKMSFPQKQWFAFRETMFKHSTVDCNQAEGIVTIFDGKSTTPLALHGGYMLYKYNPEARNLGEYLFRSMTYPQVLFTQFDFPKARVLGLRLHSSLWQDRIVQDLFITSAVDFFPMYDYSIAYVASFKPVKAIEIGAGVDFDRVLSVKDSITTPVNPTGNTRYSFAGTKIMARLFFDPKGFFTSALLGSNDLKIFGEMAILGVRNYPGYYDTLGQRIPIMFGINLPAFKFLDVLSIQGEYFRSPYPNSYLMVVNSYMPIPDYTKDLSLYKKDDWKWSIYASKKLFNGLTIIGQLANDHSRRDWVMEADADYEEAMRSNRMWYWMMKMKFEF